MKQKILWCCNGCGHSQVKWAGQCPGCGEWNSLIEEVTLQGVAKKFEAISNVQSKPLRLKEVNLENQPRLRTELEEFDRLIGGGVVVGSLTLIGGDPGIGKSTLLLQVASHLAKQGCVVLYISGEESASQTAMRAQRLRIDHDNLFVLSETNYSLIRAQVDHIKPDVLIVDSIQIVYKSEIPSAPGSVAQVRETATEFMHLAKSRGIATFLIGHVTKSGELAGPRVLEHLVDTVLYFEGDKNNYLRMLRVVKNRFGATDDIAIFQMSQQGLKEIKNPSEIFLEERKAETAGSVIIPTIEGTRPILIEVQALVSHTVFPSPTRRSAGIDQNRLALLLAVLEKRLGYPLYQRDVFVALTGGVKIVEPAIDLGILLAIASSMSNKILDPSVVVFGEVGLGGEVRSVVRSESRIKEAIHMSFKKAIVPQKNLKGLEMYYKEIELLGVEYVEEAIDELCDC